MFNTYTDDIDPDPHQRGAWTAPSYSFNVSNGLLADSFLSASSAGPELRKLGPADIAEFFRGHTETRLRQTEENRQFMKELKPEVLAMLMEKNMPVIGLFVGGEMVSGCAILYPADKDIAAYLEGYDFDGQESTTAVISAVWTNPDHGGKGYSKKAVEAGIDLALFDGKEVFRAKVDKGNAASLALFNGFRFDTSVEGQDSRKVYPHLAL